MKKRQISTLLFSLLTVAVFSNLKAAQDKQKEKTGGLFGRGPNKSKLRSQLEDAQSQIEQLKERVGNGQNCEDNFNNCNTALDNCRQHSVNLEQECNELSKQLENSRLEFEGTTTGNLSLRKTLKDKELQLENLGQDFNTKQKELVRLQGEVQDLEGLRVQARKYQGAKRETENVEGENKRLERQLNNLRKNQAGGSGGRFGPYGHGIIISLATYSALSCVDSERFGHFGPIHKAMLEAVKDSGISQAVSATANNAQGQSYGDGFHKYISERSENEITSLGNGFKAAGVNVAGETANSLVLQFCWNKWIADHVEKGNNWLTKLISRSPKKFNTLLRSTAAHLCWKLEKGRYFS